MKLLILSVWKYWNGNFLVRSEISKLILRVTDQNDLG